MTSLSSDDISRLTRFVSDYIGFSYAPDRLHDLERGFLSSCRDLGEEDPVSCLKMLENPQSAARLQDELVKKLTIGETYFFRDRNLFSYLKDFLLPDLIRSRRSSGKYLRIWCAACSTGEEPYSVAILLKYLLPDIADWNIFILGTDINPGSLHVAERGIYTKWSFREESPVPITPCFSPGIDGRQHISPKIQQMVKFSRLNLITDPYPSGLNDTNRMDLILCRNVLMYFSPELAGSVVDRMSNSLVSGGWFLVSPQELSYAQRAGLIQVRKSSVFLFQKGSVAVDEVRNKDFFAKSGGFFPDIGAGIAVMDNIESSGLQRPDFSPTVYFPRDKAETPGSILPPAFEINKPVSLPTQASIGGVLIPVSISADPESLILAGRITEAESLLQQIKQPDSNSITQMETIARIFADQGDLDRALGWCDRILALNPLRPGAYHLRALIQQERGDSSSAIQSIRQALYADPDYIPGHLMLGVMMGAQGLQADSQRHLQVCLRILSSMTDDTPVDEIDGIPAGRIREMITILLEGVK